MIARFFCRAALLLVTPPLWLTSTTTFRLEAIRSRIRSALDNSRPRK